MTTGETYGEIALLAGVAKLLDNNLPREFARPIPQSFEENRFDALQSPGRLCMVDIGNSQSYRPEPDNLNAVDGGITIKPVTISIYVFGLVMEIQNVNVGTEQDPGVLRLEKMIFDVINNSPYLGLSELVLRWNVARVDRMSWKKIDFLVGSTIELDVEIGERGRINP